MSDIAKLIDYTLLRPHAASGDIARLCREAMQFGFHSVCVNPSWVPLVRGFLSGSDVKVTTVIGFPLGATSTRVKVFEGIEASLRGADELDIVMNIGLAKSGQWLAVERDLTDIISATGGVVHKVIVETCYLDREEKIKASHAVLDSGAAFIKTSTGFGPGGATVEDILLIRSVVRDGCGIKASGGIKSLSQVRELVDAGATRIGTSSGRAIMEDVARDSGRDG